MNVDVIFNHTDRQLTNNSRRCFLERVVRTFPLPTLCLAVGECLVLCLGMETKTEVIQMDREKISLTNCVGKLMGCDSLIHSFIDKMIQ